MCLQIMLKLCVVRPGAREEPTTRQGVAFVRAQDSCQICHVCQLLHFRDCAHFFMWIFRTFMVY